MKANKKILILLSAILVVAAGGIAWLFSNYQIIGSQLYPKNAIQLDLRGQTVSTDQYAQLHEALPDCQILWDVPLSTGLYASDSTELSIPALSDTDEALLQYFPNLNTLHIGACENPALLLSLIDAYPELEIRCSVPIGGQLCPQDTAQLALAGLAPEEAALLPLLPELTLVTIDGSCDPDALRSLRDHCFSSGIELHITAGDYVFSSKDTALTIDAVTDDLIVPLSMMTQLETLHLPSPEANAENLLLLRDALSDTTVTWEKTILGKTFSSDAAEIDLTEILALNVGQVLGDRTPWQVGLEYHVQGTPEDVPSSIKVSKYHPLPDKTDETKDLIAEVEAAMAYFPDAEQVVMCGSWLHNIHMSNFRERHREDYKVVWSVQCGDLATRTDAKLFMPVKYHVYYFFTEDAYNLKFCEEMEAIDIGHMLVDDISFVKYMPNLKYLILTLGSVEDISPLSSCKNLIFLEMDWTSVTDYSPLIGCTALEDLNIGETFGNIAPVLEMHWLKNLWLVGCTHETIWMAAGSLTDTHIGAFYDNPDDGWRQLPNYFAMRDALLMYYML